MYYYFSTQCGIRPSSSDSWLCKRKELLLWNLMLQDTRVSALHQFSLVSFLLLWGFLLGSFVAKLYCLHGYCVECRLQISALFYKMNKYLYWSTTIYWVCMGFTHSAAYYSIVRLRCWNIWCAPYSWSKQKVENVSAMNSLYFNFRGPTFWSI